MKCLEEIIIYQNPNPLLVSRQAVFPGLVQLPDGDLLAMFSIGQAFDAADQRAHVSRSSDRGRTWTPPLPLHTHTYHPHEQSESFKPLLLTDGTLMAAGYAFIRPDPLTPIVDSKTFDVLPLENKVSFSSDNGHTWKTPTTIDILGAPLELSGPCIQLTSGRIIGAAAPFHLGTSGHSGWIIYSDDGGRNWGKLSEFFNTPNGEISAWECRLCEMEPGHVAVLFWAYNNKNKQNLPNHIVFSQDGGASFGPALETEIHAQASNLLWLEKNRLLTIHAHRETSPGLWVRTIDITNGDFTVEEEINLFADATMGSDSTDISKQFSSLKFGQPSLLRLDNGQVLAAFWSFENCQHIIKTYILKI